MVPNLGGWIHSFTVTETQLHKGGYTIYKITSVVFPRSVPQALTCLTVWKRFHDVKRLHRELSRRHRSLHLPGTLPEPTDCSFFKRFDAGIIRRRKEYILQLLDFAAQHPALYKCHAFAQFFSEAQLGGLDTLHRNNSIDTHKPVVETGAIAEICQKLDLHCEALSLIDPEYDKSPPKNKENGGKSPTPAIEKVQETTKAADESMNAEAAQPCKDYTRFLTPMASIESDDSDYIYEAALEFSHAVQAEANLEYQNAHSRYKRGVELLLVGSKDDTNEERKFIAKAKIAKYLARADDIHDKFLRGGNQTTNGSPKSNFQLSIDVTENTASGNAGTIFLERPWNQLAKYKVLQVLGGGVLQVQSITEPLRPTYVMKGIEKPSSNSPTQTIFLPQCVPYMVELLSFFQSEQKLFLLLKQADGGRLYDYVQQYKSTAKKTSHYADLFPEVKAENATELTNKTPSTATEFTELVRCSQQLLQSVSNTLREVKQVDDVRSNELANITGNTKIPEASLKQWARELAVAICSLHAKGVILSDLHMENLLLGSKGQLLLSYFYQNEGFEATAESYVHKPFNAAALAGHFVAPERPLSCKSDWWSYGVVLYHLLVGLSFKETHPGHIDLYGCVQYPEGVELSEIARNLLDNLLQPSPEMRYDFEQLQAHAFFAGTDWEAVRQNGTDWSTFKSTKKETAVTV